MTFSNLFALFLSMTVLAAVPSTSVLTVTARAAAGGLMHGVAAAMGVVAGDLVFIGIAVFGLALLAEAIGPAFVAVKYLGGAYLIVLGALQWRDGRRMPREAESGASRSSSFLAGLLVTLGDQKAVLFYLGFLPAFVDLAAVTPMDVAALAGVTIVAVGGVKTGYAFAAERVRRRLGDGFGRTMNVIAACVMVAVGVFLIADAWFT